MVHPITTGGGWVAIVAMWLLLALIGSEIVSRSLFSKSMIFSVEVSAWLLAIIVLMGAAWTLKAGGHIRINLMSSRLSQRNQHWLLVCLATIGLVTFAFIGIYAWQGFLGYYLIDARGSTILQFPKCWSWVPFFIGSYLLALQFASTLLESVISLKSTHKEENGLSPVWFIVLATMLLGLVSYLFVSAKVPEMSPLLILPILLILIFSIIFCSAWIFLSLTIVGILGMVIFTGYPVGQMAAKLYFNSNTNFVLICLPLFIFMGELLLHSGASQHLYGGISRWVSRIPGGLLHSNILGCTLFAAVSGSSAATCATIGSVAVPELRKLGYDEGISLGSLAGAGTLGLLIPPSGAMIVYGALTGESIGQLFMGGVIPGLILSGLFMAYIALQALRRKSIVPAAISYSWGDRWLGLVRITPIVAVIGIVLGLIYAGISTPIEASAVGAICALATAALYKKLSWKMVKEASWSTLRVTCMVLLIMSAASLLSSTFGYLRIPQHLVAAVEASGLSKYMILGILSIIYIGLGCLFDGASMMVLTLPIVYPLIISMGFNGIWFGILLTILIETAQVTPPVGFNLYVMQSISGRDIAMIVRSTIPFFFILLVGALILVLFPQLALFLPKMMISGAG